MSDRKRKKKRDDKLGYDAKVKLPDEDPEDVIRALLKVPRDQATSDEDEGSDRDSR